MRNEVPVTLFQPYIDEIYNHLRGDIFRKYIERFGDHLLASSSC